MYVFTFDRDLYSARQRLPLNSKLHFITIDLRKIATWKANHSRSPQTHQFTIIYPGSDDRQRIRRPSNDIEHRLAVLLLRPIGEGADSDRKAVDRLFPAGNQG